MDNAGQPKTTEQSWALYPTIIHSWQDPEIQDPSVVSRCSSFSLNCNAPNFGHYLAFVEDTSTYCTGEFQPIKITFYCLGEGKCSTTTKITMLSHRNRIKRIQRSSTCLDLRLIPPARCIKCINRSEYVLTVRKNRKQSSSSTPSLCEQPWPKEHKDSSKVAKKVTYKLTQLLLWKLGYPPSAAEGGDVEQEHQRRELFSRPIIMCNIT